MALNIIFSLLRKPRKVFILQIIQLFSIYFFLSGCHAKPHAHPKQPIQLSCEERSELKYLLNSLLFQDFGIYVLFGSKPMAVTSVLNDNEANEYEKKMWEALSQEEKQEYEQLLEEEKATGLLIEKLKQDPYRCWNTLQCILKRLNVKKYVFGLWPVEEMPCLYELYVADVQKTAIVIEKNYDIFRKIVGEDFHPLEVVFELENVRSPFWKKVLGNQLAQGILFGFGRKNSLYYVWDNHYQGQDPRIREYFEHVPWGKSTKKDLHHGQVSSSNFTIPCFGCIEKDKFVKRYRRERKKILKIYEGKDMVDVTLAKLAE